MNFPAPRYLSHDGFRLALYESGPKDGYPLILVHGWPEMAYSWSNQMGPLSDAGYRVIAIDLRGFGKSDAPTDMIHYGICQIVSDIEAVLDDMGVEQAALAGHDWGGIIVWNAARMLETRISHVVSLCTPHVRRAPADPIKIFRKRHGGEHYFVHFFDRLGEADALFATNPDAFFRMMFQGVKQDAKITSEVFKVPARFEAFLESNTQDGAEIMCAEDLKVYADAYRRTGFHGGINLYRNSTANWQLAEGLSEFITQPSLMISGASDLFLPPSFTHGMIELIPDLERYVIEDCGHWMMWEAPEEMNSLVIDWLGRRIN